MVAQRLYYLRLEGMLCLSLFLVVLLGAMSQLGPFEVGQIKAHLHDGLKGAKILEILKKPDGKTGWSKQAVYNAIDKLEANPSWRGEREEGSGAPRKSTEAQDKALERFVNKNKGKRKVTVQVLRRQFPWTRNVGNTLLEERLHDAGLKWLRRRRKTIVTKEYLQERIDYCNEVLAKWQSTLDTWAYTDGTVFFLDRTAAENEETQRAALGGWVWRYTDGRDAMFQENLGPSSYKKGQGVPVRVWGVEQLRSPGQGLGGAESCSGRGVCENGAGLEGNAGRRPGDRERAGCNSSGCFASCSESAACVWWTLGSSISACHVAGKGCGCVARRCWGTQGCSWAGEGS